MLDESIQAPKGERTRNVIDLAAETRCALVTIRRWLNGERVNAATDYALRSAAAKLGIDAPATHTDLGTQRHHRKAG